MLVQFLAYFKAYAKLRWLGAQPQTVQMIQIVQYGEATTPTSVLRKS
jgi:hypothetical protein